MAERIYASKRDSRNITRTQAKALRAIRAGEVHATLHHFYEFEIGGRVCTATLMALSEKGLIRFAHDETGLVIQSIG